MPDNVSTADQIRAYLLANGWQMGESGRAAYLMVRLGHAVRMLHERTEYDLNKAVFDVSLAEGRHPADVRQDILACATTTTPEWIRQNEWREIYCRDWCPRCLAVSDTSTT